MFSGFLAATYYHLGVLNLLKRWGTIQLETVDLYPPRKLQHAQTAFPRSRARAGIMAYSLLVKVAWGVPTCNTPKNEGMNNWSEWKVNLHWNQFISFLQKSEWIKNKLDFFWLPSTYMEFWRVSIFSSFLKCKTVDGYKLKMRCWWYVLRHNLVQFLRYASHQNWFAGIQNLNNHWKKQPDTNWKNGGWKMILSFWTWRCSS